MIDFSNFEKINEEAYIYRKFLDSNLADDAFQESWILSQNPRKEVRAADRVELLGGAMDKRIVDKVEDFFKNTGFEVASFLHWYTPDNVWFGLHRDDEAYDPTPLKKTWAGVIYLSDMDGGELVYPTTNTFVKPGKGDMVIHTAVVPHGATPIVGGNKRTITYVVYDTNNKINPEEEPHGREVWEIGNKQIIESIDWHNSKFGKMWKEATENN